MLPLTFWLGHMAIPMARGHGIKLHVCGREDGLVSTASGASHPLSCPRSICMISHCKSCFTRQTSWWLLSMLRSLTLQSTPLGAPGIWVRVTFSPRETPINSPAYEEQEQSRGCNRPFFSSLLFILLRVQTSWGEQWSKKLQEETTPLLGFPDPPEADAGSGLIILSLPESSLLFHIS
jgi:hypothetical protein